MRTMRIVCTGGRDYLDGGMVFATLNLLDPTEVYVGDCPSGADAFVAEWLEQNPKVKSTVYHASWKAYGKIAGPMRNGMMLEDAGSDALVIAFKGGRGTKDCVTKALTKGMIVLEVRP